MFLTQEHLASQQARYDYLCEMQQYFYKYKKNQIQDFIDNRAGQMSQQAAYQIRAEFAQTPTSFEKSNLLTEELFALEVEIEFLKNYLGENNDQVS